MPETMKATQLKPGATVVGGGLGGGLAALVVTFMPPDWHVFTPETAAVSTAAFGAVISYLVRYLPAPKR